MKILVVDDEKEIVANLSEYLSLKGISVSQAFSGEEALSIIEKEKLDAVLLDVRMPGIQGTEVARIIKNKSPVTKVIIMTGFPEDMSEKLIQEKILDEVFVKPFKLEALYNKLLESLSVHMSQPQDSKTKRRMKARVLLIKSRMLVLEPDNKIYLLLKDYFKSRSYSGEEYQIEPAVDTSEVFMKIETFIPDIVLVNGEAIKEKGLELYLKLGEMGRYPKEIIQYHANKENGISREDIKELSKSVQKACFNNGLIEIKWVEI